jgi:hypothetical protein
MDTQQIVEVLSQMKADQAKAEANRKADQAQMVSNMKTIQERMEASQERMENRLKEAMRVTVSAMNERMDAIVHSSRSERDEKTESRSESVPERQEIPKEGAALASLECEEEGPKEEESEAERREVPTVEAAMESSRVMKKRSRGRRTAAGRRVKPTKLTRKDGESRRRLVAACRKVSRSSTVAWRRRTIFTDIWTQVNCGPREEWSSAGMRRICWTGEEQRKERGTQKRLKNETRLWNDAEGNNGMRRKDVKEPLHLRKGKKVADGIGGRSRRQRLRVRVAPLIICGFFHRLYRFIGEHRGRNYNPI